MCKRIKTRKEIASQSYLCVEDIRKLLDVSWPKAKKIYTYCRAIDDKDLKPYIVEPTKVRIKTVCKVIKMDINMIKKMVKDCPERDYSRKKKQQEQTATE